MTWRVWVYQRLVASPDVVAIVPAARWFGSSRLRDRPAQVPFGIVTMGTDVGVAGVGVRTNMTVSVHDNPGDYMRIDSALKAVRAALEGPATGEGQISADWQSFSDDMMDEGFNTTYRVATFQLFARREKE